MIALVPDFISVTMTHMTHMTHGTHFMGHQGPKSCCRFKIAENWPTDRLKHALKSYKNFGDRFWIYRKFWVI